MQTFKQQIHDEITVLTNRWRKIERLLKRAERVQQSATIPAINELRYAGRQIFELPAFFLREAIVISAVEKKHIQKRIYIAEQYLLNAEHDIVDGLIRYFLKITRDINEMIGKARIVEYYHDYNVFIDLIDECLQKIEDSRADSAKRTENYRHIISHSIDQLIGCYSKFLDAEVSARLGLEQAEFLNQVALEKAAKDRQDAVNEAIKIRGVNRVLAGISVISAIVTVCSAIIAIYLWRHSSGELCIAGANAVVAFLCGF